MLIQERVLAANTEAMLLAVAKLQLKKVNLDDAWFSCQDVFLWSLPAELMTRISLAKLEGERVSKLPLRNDELSIP